VHFRSKEEVLYRICLTAHQRTLEVVRAAAATGTRPAEQLHAVIEELATRQSRNHSAVRVVEYELHCLSPEHHAEVTVLRRAIDHLVRGILADGAASGAFDVPDVVGTAMALLSMCTDVARWYRTSDRWPPEELGRLYADLALRMVRPPA
jgi:AcrR family transcriptional regulator